MEACRSQASSNHIKRRPGLKILKRGRRIGLPILRIFHRGGEVLLKLLRVHAKALQRLQEG